ncbi:ATP-binding protein [Caldithrix abyssi]
MVERSLENIILKYLDLNKIIIIYGARQVGKTTLVKMLLDKIDEPYLLLNGDEPDIREILTKATSTRLHALIGNKNVVVFDEAQRIPEIGLVLKLLHDSTKKLKIIVTGSSSLNLADELQEPLTGRKFVFKLYPFSFKEMVNHTSLLEEKRLLEHRLIYGYYPEIVNRPGSEQILLRELTESYLYKDILSMGLVKKPYILDKLLKALALQIGQEVSFNELGQLIGADKQTVEKYIALLEKSFVIFRLPTFSRNLRNEIKKNRKIYFYDNGIRNALIKNFNSLPLRADVGALWENFFIAERMKYLNNGLKPVNYYFWRTHSQQEIDYLEETGGQLTAYEIKWNPRKKVRFPEKFLKTYQPAQTYVIHPENYFDFLL